MMVSRLPKLVKGAGYIGEGGVVPLHDSDDRVWTLAAKAERALKESASEGLHHPDKVVKSFSSEFGQQLAQFLQFQPGNNAMTQLVNQLNSVLSTELGKNISLTAPLSSGFVPFDLLAPSRLIYPVYSPMRNKLPRTPGQGTSRRVKLINGISGSRTAGSVGKSVRWSISEFPGGGSFSSWPNQLPGPGQQNAVDFDIPYQFFGLSESLSWLAQFAGQGFEDISALANLILLQEAMIAEEDAIFSGTGHALATPSAPTAVPRTASSAETALTGVTTNIYVRVTALNYYGETVASTSATAAPTSTQVVDVTIAPVYGAFQYNIYVGTGTADPANHYLMVSQTGATKVTLQGALPTGGTTPPTADTGTSSSTDFEGLLSVLDGHAGPVNHPDPAGSGIYPQGWTGVGNNKSAGGILGLATLYPVLQALWDTGATADGTAGAYRANPAELLCEGSDASRLATDILSNGADTSAYRTFVGQDEVGGIKTGAAVSMVQNPITRAVVNVLVHPWLTQGTAFLMSYTIPMAWSNVTNCWEMVMVQDLLSVSWPVIDATFRYSIFEYGSFVGYAPQFSAVIQGLQKSATAPFS